MDEIKGNAPRVRPEDLEAEIAAEFYFTANDGVNGARDRLGSYELVCIRHEDTTCQPVLARLTFCTLVLHCGFTVTGQASCVSAENFDAEKGRKIARAKAIEKLWPLLGFRLADKLHAKAHAERVVATIDDADD